jgi:hypothetical protein
MGAHRENDAVVRSILGDASPAVRTHDPNTADAGGGKVCPGGGHEVVVDVNGGHTARWADEMSEKGGVIPCAGTDLENALPGPYIELLQHDGHDLWLRGRADYLAVGHLLRDDPAITVGLRDGGVGDEKMARQSGERLCDRWGAQAAFGPKRLNELGAEHLRT